MFLKNIQKDLTRLLFAVCVIAMFCSCSVTKFVPAGETLLNKNVISLQQNFLDRLSPTDPLSPLELESYIMQKPNKRILLGWKSRLMLYSLRSHKDNWWSNLVEKIAEAPVIFDTLSLSKSVQNLEQRLVSLGYYGSNVTSQFATENRKTNVTYSITLGNRYILDSITYNIQSNSINEVFFADTTNSLVKRGDYLSATNLEEESKRITEYLRSKGFYDFSKGHIAFVADTFLNAGYARLQYKINDYLRGGDSLKSETHNVYKIRNINIFTNYNAVSAAMDANYASQLQSVSYNGLRLFYNNKLNIRPKVLRSLMLLDTGMVYNERVVNRSYDRLTKLRLFNSVTYLFNKVDSITPDSLRLLDCDVRLSQSSMQGYKLNFEISSNSTGLIGLSPNLSYYHKNIFHGGELLTIGLMGNFQFKFNDPIHSNEMGTSMTLSFPKMLLPWGTKYTKGNSTTDISASFNYQTRAEYERSIASLSYGFVWNEGHFRYGFAPVEFGIVKLFKMSDGFIAGLENPFLLNTYRDHFSLGSSASVYYTSDVATKHNYDWFYLYGRVKSSGNVLSLFNETMRKDVETGSHLIYRIAYSQYVKGEITGVYNKVFGKAHSLVGRLYGGIGKAYGNSHTLPLEEQFYCGGANSLRAWQARSVGPGDALRDTTFSIPNQMGDVKLEANLEYRFPMIWKLEGALFADCGNVWTLEKSEGRFKFSNFYNSLAVDGGFGIRLNLEFVLLRLDLGMAMRNPITHRWIPAGNWLKSNNCTIQFGVGYPF